MKIFYRGVRLKEHQIEDFLKNGMTYYWKNPEQSINDLFHALQKHHRIKKLGTSELVRDLILEASKEYRLQIYGSESRENAESYARATPELIFEALRFSGIEYVKIMRFLNERYGEPHLVTFYDKSEPTYIQEINKTFGKFIPPERISTIEKVDIDKPDPYMKKLRDSVQTL